MSSYCQACLSTGSSVSASPIHSATEQRIQRIRTALNDFGDQLTTSNRASPLQGHNNDTSLGWRPSYRENQDKKKDNMGLTPSCEMYLDNLKESPPPDNRLSCSKLLTYIELLRQGFFSLCDAVREDMQTMRQEMMKTMMRAIQQHPVSINPIEKDLLSGPVAQQDKAIDMLKKDAQKMAAAVENLTRRVNQMQVGATKGNMVEEHTRLKHIVTPSVIDPSWEKTMLAKVDSLLRESRASITAEVMSDLQPTVSHVRRFSSAQQSAGSALLQDELNTVERKVSASIRKIEIEIQRNNDDVRNLREEIRKALSTMCRSLNCSLPVF